MNEHLDYLAIHVINESSTVSYRQLSRALEIPVNVAKRCLHDFHHRQNTKHPSSVHATYLLTGLRNPPSASQTNGPHDDKEGEDVPMSSPYPSSLPDMSQPESSAALVAAAPMRIVLLAAESDLAAAKASLDEVTGVHVYSLSSAPVGDLAVLSDCHRKVRTEYYKEDPLEAWKKYGVIQNDKVWRRTRGGEPQKPPDPVGKVEAAKQQQEQKTTTVTATATTAKKQEVERAKKETASLSSQTSDKSGKAPTLKTESSSLFKSFAKSKPPKAKEKKIDKDEDDATPALSDEDVEDGDVMDLDDGAIDGDSHKARPAAAEPGKTRKDREAELRKMMEEDDEDEDEEMVDAQPEAEEVDDADGAVTAKEQVTGADDKEAGGNGRRRGRRRVMKKKTVKDEEGYLVTKEEAAWESFSEDEAPAIKKPKPSIFAQAAAKSQSQSQSQSGGVGKKAPKSQNSIMSFFAKK